MICMYVCMYRERSHTPEKKKKNKLVMYVMISHPYITRDRREADAGAQVCICMYVHMYICILLMQINNTRPKQHVLS